MSVDANIAICKTNRLKVAAIVAEVLKNANGLSEVTLASSVANTTYKDNFHPQGWYDPPPRGVAVHASPPNNYERLRYDSLRKPAAWPQQSQTVHQDGATFVYVSPVDKVSGIIADFGLAFYGGSDKNVQNHFVQCLDMLEKAANYIAEGMQFREIHDYTQHLMAEAGLTNKRMVTFQDPVGSNLGHTVPWTHELPTDDELATIRGSDFDKIKNLISTKRIHINTKEQFVIPQDIAFTFESRLESLADNTLPNAYYHFIIIFRGGKKEILGNFKPVFDTLDINYIRSKY